MKFTDSIFSSIRGFFALLVVTSLALLASCDDKSNDPMPAERNIVRIIEKNSRFSTLAVALNKANLITTLSADTSTFTVFAPTNEAFAKMSPPFNSAANIASITNASQLAILRGILLYHILPGTVETKDIVSEASSQTTLRPPNKYYINNNKSFLTKKPSGVFINGLAKIVEADIDASNGKIHAIDNVLLAPNYETITLLFDLTNGSPRECTLLLEALSTPAGRYVMGNIAHPWEGSTLFAPTDAAFRAFLKGAPLSSLDEPTLLAILSRHVVPTSHVFSSDLSTGPLTTLAGPNAVTVQTTGNNITLHGGAGSPATIVASNLLTINGVIHIIDQVIQP